MAQDEVVGFNEATDFDAAQARRLARVYRVAGEQAELNARDLLYGIAVHLGLVDTRTGYWTQVMHNRLNAPKEQARTATELRAAAAESKAGAAQGGSAGESGSGSRQGARAAQRGAQGQGAASDEVPDLPQRG